MAIYWNSGLPMLSKAIGRKGGDLFQTARLLKKELLQLTLLGVTEAEGAGPQITSDVDARRSSAAACWHGRTSGAGRFTQPGRQVTTTVRSRPMKIVKTMAPIKKSTATAAIKLYDKTKNPAAHCFVSVTRSALQEVIASQELKGLGNI